MECVKCGRYAKFFDVCYKCYQELKNDVVKEITIEFEKLYNSNDTNNEAFIKANEEVRHNTHYENLTPKEYKQYVFGEFLSNCRGKMIYHKIQEIKATKKAQLSNN